MGNKAFPLGIKISVILLHLWEDIPSLKSPTASPTWRMLTEAILALAGPVTAAVHPGQPMPSLPGSWNRAGIDGTARGEAAEMQRRSSMHHHTVCTAGSLPVLYTTIQMAANITSFFGRRDIDQVWFYFTIYQTCLGQHLMPDRNGHLKTLFLKISGCNAVTIAFKQKGIRSSLGVEGMMLTEGKENLIMAQRKRCFSGTILIVSWVLLFNGLLA